MNHKKKAIYLGLLLTISLIFINTSCKNFGVPDYQFTVTLGEGVSGTPAAGTYSYKELSVVTYNYAFTNEEDRFPGVFINDATLAAPPEGDITLFRNIDIYVGDVDIRGEWKLTITDTNDVETESVFIFSGDTIFSGTFTDSRNYVGTWTVTNYNITITFTDWNGETFTGDISPKYLAGNVLFNEAIRGTWRMERDSQ